MSANLETAVATGLEKVSFHYSPKEGQRQRMFNLLDNCSHTGKIMLKFLQARLQQYRNRELLDVQAGFRKGKGTSDQTANIPHLIEKAREFQKNVYFCFFDYIKAFVWITTNWKILQEMGLPDHLACLLRNLWVKKQQFKPSREQWTG